MPAEKGFITAEGRRMQQHINLMASGKIAGQFGDAHVITDDHTEGETPDLKHKHMITTVKKQLFHGIAKLGDMQLVIPAVVSPVGFDQHLRDVMRSCASCRANPARIDVCVFAPPQPAA